MWQMPSYFLFSGGLDYFFVYTFITKRNTKLIIKFAIVMIKDAIDLKYTKQVVEYIRIGHRKHYPL